MAWDKLEQQIERNKIERDKRRTDAIPEDKGRKISVCFRFPIAWQRIFKKEAERRSRVTGIKWRYMDIIREAVREHVSKIAETERKGKTDSRGSQ